MEIDLEKIRNEKPLEELIKFSIINLDKPTGPTSFLVSDFVRILFKLNKTSHFGTLDPQVTGVLPVALGRACKLNDFFMHKDKEYVGIMRLHEDVDEQKLKKVISKFIGKITQLPPVKSNVKRANRVREVKSFEIIERDGKDILFKTNVEAGTYVRKLIHDIGEELGGAHMLELRRVTAGLFSENDSNFVNLYDLEKAYNDSKKGDEKALRKILIPGEFISKVLPSFEANSRDIKQLLTGKPIFKDDIIFDKKLDLLNKGDKIALFLNQKFIGCYRITLEKVIFARPEFVFN
jgi:H/ACA ribonucleoprotein complex subunit 4